MWNGRFWDICGSGFTSNDFGAALFCKKLGYEKGTMEIMSDGKKGATSSFFVGECSQKDKSLLKCGGVHKATIMPTAECSIGFHYRVHCSGGKGSKISCEGKKILSMSMLFSYLLHNFLFVNYRDMLCMHAYLLCKLPGLG